MTPQDLFLIGLIAVFAACVVYLVCRKIKKNKAKKEYEQRQLAKKQEQEKNK